MEVRIPQLAEGIDAATVVSVLVKVGDTVRKDQPLAELETEKAVAPLPSPAAGKVEKILIKEGNQVAVGQVIMALAGGREEKLAPTPAAPPSAKPAAPATARPSTPGVSIPASPSLRKLARELGVDLSLVPGSGYGGRITTEDVRSYFQRLQQSATAGSAPSVKSAAPIDFSQWGPVSKKKMTSLRKKIAEKMTASWVTIPHVTQFDKADITRLSELREKYVSVYEKKGARLTVTALLLKALVDTLKKHPHFNASLEEASEEIVTKHYYHIGLAVDTEQGLIVPVLRDVDKKDMLKLSLEIQELAEKTRQRKISLGELQGGSFTVSNQGGIGGGHFTPIVNKPEVAILGIGRSALEPVVRGGKIQTAMLLPLALSYDHRLIDGAQAARFITDLVKTLENFPEDWVRLKK